MVITIPDEDIKQMVEEKSRENIRRRIKEMQGDYTSKAYIENVMRDVIWEKVQNLCPNIEELIVAEVDKCISLSMSNGEIKKTQLVNDIVEQLLEHCGN